MNPTGAYKSAFQPNQAIAPETELPERALRSALDEVVYSNLRPVATGLTLLYIILAVSHLLVLPESLIVPMTVTAATSAVLLLGLRIFLTRRSLPSRWIYPVALSIAALVLVNSLLHLYLSGEPRQTTNLMLLIIAVSFFLLDRTWFIVSLTIILISWIAVALTIGPSPQWPHYGFALFISTLVGILMHLTHLQNLRRLHCLQVRQEQHNARLHAEIDERRQAEQALRESEEKLRQMQAEVANIARLSLAGEIASGLAHELNQPLTAIAASADACQLLLKSDRMAPEALTETLNQISAQSHRAGEIIRWMRNFTRKTKSRWTRVDLNTLIRETTRFLEPEIRQHGVTLHLELDPLLPLIHGDPIEIQQVVMNLMRNSIEAFGNSEDGTRQLTIQTAPTQNSAVEVVVSDTGPGLSAEAVDRLFMPFFSTKPGCMGLGLPISKSIIEAHEGRLWMTPNKGAGTAFHFTLPAST